MSRSKRRKQGRKTMRMRDRGRSRIRWKRKYSRRREFLRRSRSKSIERKKI